MPKPNKVPTNTYSDFTESFSLNLSSDLAASKKPIMNENNQEQMKVMSAWMYKLLDRKALSALF